jgi:hypothetical protein
VAVPFDTALPSVLESAADISNARAPSAEASDVRELAGGDPLARARAKEFFDLVGS